MRSGLRKTCDRQLKEVFGLSAYRPGQKEAVKALLSGRDVLCVLPTGSGKSLCWQLPANVHDGLTLVVSPLIALMRDQVMHLTALGIAAAAIDSLMTIEEQRAVLEHVRQGKVKILFLSPERLGTDQIRSLCQTVPPWLVVVDEAHCMVQWGQSFRPAYEKIGALIHALPAVPVLCALTATADPRLQREILRLLDMRRVKRILLPLTRENLVYEVRTTLDTTAEILHMLRTDPCKTVVFCRSRARVDWLAAFLVKQGISALGYHAGMEREKRLEIQERFADGSIQVLCATTAFGMGVDVPDIRRIIHDDIPEDIISYVQQTGRAGRDGQDASCIMLIEPNRIVRSSMNPRRELKHGLRAWLKAQKSMRERQRLMKLLLTAACIPAGSARYFGQRHLPCGRCSACMKGSMLRRIPPLSRMKPAQIRVFLLKWQRDALAHQQGVRPGEILSDAVINAAAKQLVFPEECRVPPPLERLLQHFQKDA